MHRRIIKLRFLFLSAVLLAAIVSSISPSPCHAQAPTATVTIQHSFSDGSVANDGFWPNSPPVLGVDGNFYGTTPHGGSDGYGNLYKMTPSGQITTLYSFLFSTGDGLEPNGGIVQASDGNFYGTTYEGGSTESSDTFPTFGLGTIFKVTSTGQETVLHSFEDGSIANDGFNPGTGLTQGSDGNLYGTASFGGSTGRFVQGITGEEGAGVVFKMSLTGQVAILHSFGDGSVANDGVGPSSSLVEGSDGNYYGLTVYGGFASVGTVYKITPSGHVTILHSFCDGSVPNDGVTPIGALIQARDGNLYGTTPAGGSAGLGTVFRMTPSGQITILHSFGDGSVDNDGLEPQAGVIQGPDGNFYGTTQLGGSTLNEVVTGPPGPDGLGVIFQITPSGKLTILHMFLDGTVANDGAGPTSGLTQGLDGNLYGTTLDGGTAHDGDVYKVTLKAATTINPPAGLQMFSLPYSYYGVNLDGLLGYTGATVATWQPAQGQYAITPTAPANQFVPGQSYWVRFPQAASITLPGAPADTTQNFDIRLTKGWNMIGDPFTKSTPVTDLLFSNGTETFARAIAGGNPLIGRTVWSYSQASNQYTPATTLAPEQGYWIFASADTDVQVPHP